MKKALMIVAIIISVILLAGFWLIIFVAHKVSTTVGEGTLSGKVTIGPICPVERPDVPCPVPAEAYEARKILVYIQLKGGLALYSDVSIKTDGTYSVNLPEGAYVVEMKPNGIDRSPDVPADIVIKAGETTTLDISIDTGIR
jgi:hypothetical protein